MANSSTGKFQAQVQFWKAALFALKIEGFFVFEIFVNEGAFGEKKWMKNIRCIDFSLFDCTILSLLEH